MLSLVCIESEASFSTSGFDAVNETMHISSLILQATNNDELASENGLFNRLINQDRLIKRCPTTEDTSSTPLDVAQKTETDYTSMTTGIKPTGSLTATFAEEHSTLKQPFV